MIVYMSLFSDYTDNLNSVYEKEKELDQNITDYNTNPDDDVKTKNHDMYIEQKKMTSSLMKGMEQDLYFSRELTKDNEFYNDLLEDEYERLEELNIEKDKKNKINEINVYYEKKRKHQIVIFKNVCYILIVLIFISILYHLGIIPEIVFIITIGIGTACLVIYLGNETMDMMFRNNIKYDEYDHMPLRSYKNKSIKTNEETNLDKPLHGQKDLISQECYLTMNE